MSCANHIPTYVYTLKREFIGVQHMNPHHMDSHHMGLISYITTKNLVFSHMQLATWMRLIHARC
jgi:hypothetical protein